MRYIYFMRRYREDMESLVTFPFGQTYECGKWYKKIRRLNPSMEEVYPQAIYILGEVKILLLVNKFWNFFWGLSSSSLIFFGTQTK